MLGALHDILAETAAKVGGRAQRDPLSGGIVGYLDVAGSGRRTQLMKVVE